MIAGKLTDIVDVYRPVTVKDAFGAKDRTEWENVGRWHCERVKHSGKTIVEASELWPDYRATLNVAWAHRPSEGWKVILDNIEYTITAIIPNRQRGMRTLTIDRINS